jgi:hypothetical protein
MHRDGPVVGIGGAPSLLDALRSPDRRFTRLALQFSPEGTSMVPSTSAFPFPATISFHPEPVRGKSRNARNSIPLASMPASTLARLPWFTWGTALSTEMSKMLGLNNPVHHCHRKGRPYSRPFRLQRLVPPVFYTLALVSVLENNPDFRNACFPR